MKHHPLFNIQKMSGVVKRYRCFLYILTNKKEHRKQVICFR